MTSIDEKSAGRADLAKAEFQMPAVDGAADYFTIADEASKTVSAAWSSPSDGKGQMMSAEKAKLELPDPSLLTRLAELQVRRKFYIGLVNKQTNAAKALVRRALGWRYDDEESGRKGINERAARIVVAAFAGKDQKPEDQKIFAALAVDLAVISMAIKPCAETRHAIELDMQRIARRLPVYPWAKAIKGFGDRALAVVVAEAGDLSGYPKKGHLWRRLGLAPFEGNAYSTWRMKGGLSAEQWTEAGYSPRRRAEIFALVSEPLLKLQTPNDPYRAIYDRRRARTAETHPDWTKAHSHMDALRVMTKHLIRDLWVAWRASFALPEKAIKAMPAKSNRRKATPVLPLAEAPVPPGGAEAELAVPQGHFASASAIHQGETQ